MAQAEEILAELDTLDFAERLRLVEMELSRLRLHWGQQVGDVWHGKSVQKLAEEQGVQPVQNIMEHRVDFWPPEESVDEFIATVRQWRDESKES